MMQNLRKNWPVVTKSTWGFWWIFTQALVKILKICKFWGLMQNLKEKLTCAFKTNLRNLANFHRLKNSAFILKSKMGEQNKNKNSDVVWKRCFRLKINE